MNYTKRLYIRCNPCFGYKYSWIQRNSHF